MNYSNFQKILSFVLLFFILTGTTFRVPFTQVLYSVALASETESKDLVSILVEEEIYPYIRDDLKRYSIDIQDKLPNTKGVIVPIPKGSTPYEIASINEKLYFEGEKNNELFKNKLIGTVLVGNLPVPTVTDGANSGPSILPFTDFVNKGFIYNAESENYSLNRGLVGDVKPEIWHGVIYPNTGKKATDISAYKRFFKKNHNFYTKKGQFSNVEIKANEPSVFYFDAITEQKSINYINYKAYELYLNNLEDLTYRRYTKGLAKKVQDEFSKLEDEKVGEALKDILDEEVDVSALKGGLALDNAPDVQARYIINKIIKKYPEVLNTSVIGQMQKDVYNAGRYNVGGKKVNVDFISTYVTLLDRIASNVLKDASDDLEGKIDELVKNGLARDIAIPMTYSNSKSGTNSSIATYTNILNGHAVTKKDFDSAIDCSIYRGSVDNGGKLVEANRGYNIGNLQGDINRLKSEDARSCMDPLKVNARFGGNTPLNLDNVAMKDGEFKLKSSVLNGGIVPVFDIKGTRETKDSSLTPSPKNCLVPNFALTYKETTRSSGGRDGNTVKEIYKVPLSLDVNDRGDKLWSCSSPLLSKVVPFTESFNTMATIGPKLGSCEVKSVYLDGKLLKNYSSHCPSGSDGDREDPEVSSYNYKSISSVIEHKSPTRAEIEAQLKANVTRDLPIDKDRYIDFIAANGVYKKINYPYLFRVSPYDNTEKGDRNLSYVSLKKALKKVLDDKSKEINDIISSSSASGNVYNALKVGPYPTNNIDLYQTILDKGSETFKQNGVEKKGKVYKQGNNKKYVTYEDLLLFSIYWNNLNSVPAKYKFIFENYLGDQFENKDPYNGGESSEKSNLLIPNKKTNYEIAYLKATGDASKLILNVDPEAEGDNPFTDIVLANAKKDLQIQSNKSVKSQDNSSDNDSCSPPEGVPIWEWLPAVMCRLGEVTQSKPEFSDGTCGVKQLFDTENALGEENKKACEKDDNRNGIYDCFESSDNLEISGTESLYYNSVGNFDVKIKAKDKLVSYDSQSAITLEVVRIEIPKDENKNFSPINLKIIYDKDRGIGSKDLIKNYVTYPESSQIAKNGTIKATISSSNKIANVYFRAKSIMKPYIGKEDKVLTSQKYRLDIRDSKLQVSAKRMSLSGNSVDVTLSDKIIASDKKNVFIYDETSYRLDNNKDFLNSLSTSKEKVFIGIRDISASGITENLEYPITVEVKNGLNLVGKAKTFSKSDLEAPFSIGSFEKAGTYTIFIKDSKGKSYKKEFDVTPEKPSKIEANYVTNYFEKDGVITQNIVTALDKFGNVTSGEFYNFDLSINGDSIVFDEENYKGNNARAFVSEGFKVFRLKSTNKTGKAIVTVKLTGKDGDVFYTEDGKDIVKTQELTVVDKFDIDVKFPQNGLDVGEKEYTVNFNVNKPEGLDTTAFVKVDSLYATVDNDKVGISKGFGSFKLKTGKVATQDTNATIKIAGMRNAYSENFKINPGKLFKIDLSYPESVEPGEEFYVKVLYKDKYGNERTIYQGDSFAGVEFEKKYLRNFDLENISYKVGNKYVSTVPLNKTFQKLKASQIPGIVYFKVHAGASGSSVASVGKVSIGARLDKELASNMGYNALYTTMLGADYGNIYDKDSVANAMIFSSDNKSLAVTGVLSKSKRSTNLVTVQPKGDINIFESSDLTQNIKYKFVNNEKPLTFELFNDTLNQPVAKVVYSYSKADFVKCENSDCNEKLSKKDDSKNYLGYIGDNFSYNKGILTLKNSSGDKILDVYSDGSVRNLKDGTTIQIDNNNLNPYLGLNIMDPFGKKLGYLIYYFNGEIKYANGSSYFKWSKGADGEIHQQNSSIYSQTDSVFFLANNSDYGLQFSYNGIDKTNNRPISLYYRGSLGDSNSSISDLTPWGYEFFETDSIGWEGENKTLLSFASGETVGEATMKYASVGMINIGDPVLSLQKDRAIEEVKGETVKSRKFDSTVGKLIYESDDLLDYKIFDYNNDGNNDLVVFQKDGVIKLYEIRNGSLTFKSDIAKLSDAGASSKYAVGDFSGDGFDDIFFFTSSGEPALLNNYQKDFARVDVRKDIKFEGRPMQVEAFDMDADGKDDIVTLDDSGDIVIFYGVGTSNKPEFAINKIGEGFALSLNYDDTNKALRKDYASIYFNGLKQLDQTDEVSPNNFDTNIIKNSIKKALDGAKSSKKQEDFNKIFRDNKVNFDALESLIFERYKYDPLTLKEELELTEKQKEEKLIKKISDTPMVSDSVVNQFRKSLKQIRENTSGGISYGKIKAETPYTTFIKSEYAESYGLRYSKEFIDINGKPLKSGDKVKVVVTLANDSKKDIENVSIIEKVEDLFDLPKDFFVKSGDDTVSYVDIPNPTNDRGFMLENIKVKKGRFYSFEYELDVKKFDYGYIKVGYYGSGKENIDSDIYGDVLFKDSNQNCNYDENILLSTTSRDYIATTKAGSCKSSLSTKKDNDKDGVPDYINELVKSAEDAKNGGSATKIEEYSKTQLEKFSKDLDGDGILNDEDVDVMGSFEDGDSVITIDVDVDKIASDIQDVIDGFGCGFGSGCIPTPLNWAPLAPGGDPTLFGYPIGDGLHVSEGVPIFAFPTIGPVAPFGVPTPPYWPTNFIGAGGVFPGMISQYRMFVTPTLTGAAGMAFCTGPNYVAGYNPPPGVSPMVPGGNCIVVALPLMSCDDSNGDPSTVGSPSSSGNGFNVYNGNCSSIKSTPKVTLKPDFVKQYVDGNTDNNTFAGEFNDQLQNLDDIKTLPLFSGITTGGGDGPKYSLSFDSTNGLDLGNINELKNLRIHGFPKPIMSWASRQLEEIATKITDFPRLILILPDVDGLTEGWDGFEEEWKQFKEEISKGKNEADAKLKAEIAKKQNEISSIETKIAEEENKKVVNKSAIYKMQLKKEQLEVEVWGLQKQASFGVSSIKGAYEAVSKLPLIKVDEQTVDITLPWASKATLDDAIYRWSQALDQRKAEIEDKKRKWSFGKYGCDGELTPKEKKACNQKIQVQLDVITKSEDFLTSLERNIEVLESYKELPRDVNKLLRQKEVRLEQILCNVETISQILGKWIKDNGKIFKSWVELFILVKAILKSWQVLVDIFVGYETKCKQCKNERQDLLTFVFSLILPEIPIIRFPKWPDIILDVHNIRGGIAISIPVFEVDYEPLVLPDLPALKLPEVPSIELLAELEIPTLPTLPEIELPELPDLPTLPQVKLPNLPPAPQLPKIFGALEVVADLLKLISQVMCILKMSPFVPEWRAGDQIAFLTERSGFLDLDFLVDLSLPEVSLPAVDGIKVSSYVNLEMRFDDIAEMIQEALDNSVNKFGNNIANSINSSLPDLDFSNVIPSTISGSVKVNKDGVKTETDLGEGETVSPGDVIENIGDAIKEKGDGIESELQGFNFTQEELIAHSISAFVKGLDKIDSEKDIKMSASEFTDFMYNKLYSEKYLKDPKFDKLRKIWKDVKEYSYSKENEFIGKLVKNNEDKFKELEEILESEIKHNQDLRKEIEKMFNGEKEKVSLVSEKTDRFKNYNSKLSKYSKFETNNEKDVYAEGIINERNNLLNDAKSLLKNNSLALNKTRQTANPVQISGFKTSAPATTCEGVPAGYEREYKGLYVNNNKLFDYAEELTGNEKTLIIDGDLDGDDDILYMMNNQIYLKENLSENNKTVNKNSTIISQELKAEYLIKDFISSVDNVEESVLDNEYLNISFSASTDKSINNYRYEAWQIVDRFEGKDNLPNNKNLRKYQVDSFSDINNATLTKNSFDNKDFVTRKNLATITYVGKLPGVVLTYPSLVDVYDKVASGVSVNVTTGTKLYAGIQDVELTYTMDGKQKTTVIKAKTNVEILSTIVINKLNGSLYIEGNGDTVVTNPTVSDVLGLPLLPGAYARSIAYNKNATLLNVEYYDGAKSEVDFKDTYAYRLYDLGSKSDSYNIRIPVPNDFYYSKMYSFKGNLTGTYNEQMVVGPQIESDLSAPGVSLKNIFIPVYKEKEILIGDYIYDNSDNTKVSNISMDTDIKLDSDGDGITNNDSDVVLHSGEAIKPENLKFILGPYDKPFEKKVAIFIEDQIGNTSTSEITIISYAPKPTIYDYSSGKVSGAIADKVGKEPISLFRFRNGNLEKVNEKPSVTSEEGTFSYEKDKDAKGLRVKYNGRTIAIIDDKTGQIAFKSGYDYSKNTDVLASNNRDNDTSFPLIRIKVGSEVIYTQYISYDDVGAVSPVSNFEESGDTPGVYFKLNNQNSFGIYKIPTTAVYDKGSVVVYSNSNVNKDPLFKIYRDGRIEVLNKAYKLKLSTYKGFVTYKLMKGSVEIGETLIIPEGNYVIGE